MTTYSFKDVKGQGIKLHPSLQKLIQSGIAQPYDASHGVPSGWVLCCPFCEALKMRPFLLAQLKGYICTGVDLDICGKFINKLEVDLHKGLYIVKE